MKRILEKIRKKLRVFFARQGYTCDGCGTELFDYPLHRFCEDCESKMLKNDGHACIKCGRKTVTEGVCLDCKRKLPRFTVGASPFVYGGQTAAYINRMKNGNQRLALYFGERAAAALLRSVPDIKMQFDGGRYALNEEDTLLILPVPLTKQKRKERGYNQAELLAQSVEMALEKAGVAVTVDRYALEKRRDTAQQKHLRFADREKNVVGAYHLHKRAFCKGRTVLLVDDIMTTGATGSECARLLFGAGAKRVIFLVAAALPESKKRSDKPLANG